MTDRPMAGVLNWMWRIVVEHLEGPDVESIEDIVQNLIQVMTQKTGGQAAHKKASDIYIGNAAMLLNMAAMELVRLYQSPRWNKIKEILEEKT